MLRFDDIFIDYTRLGRKIPKEKYLQKGKHIIIDQGQNDIAGYSNEEDGIFSDIPVIIFGDHTRIFKLIKSPFFLGADGTKILKAKISNMSYDYLYYYLKYKKIPNTGYNRHFKWLKELTFEIKDFNEQEKISTVLNKVSKILEMKKQQLSEFDKLVKFQFLKMFGDPILNEKNWKKVSCKEIISKIGSGSTPLGGNKNYKSKGISFIRSLNVHNNKFINDGLVFIDEKQSEKLKNVNVEKDDILFNITGASVARSCIVPLNILPARVNQHVSIIRCNKEIIKPIFLCSQLTNIQYQSFLLKIAKNNGATREALTKEQLENLNIILPPIELQNKFADFVKQVDKSKVILGKALKSLSFRLNYYYML